MTDAVVLAKLVKQYNTQGKNLARVLYKLWSGQTVKITGLGDSVNAGGSMGGGSIGTDDWMPVLAATLRTRFPLATVVLNNRAISGTTVAAQRKLAWAAALADNADLYILSGGKNDITADLTGQPNDSSVGMIEAMVTELRLSRPDADLLINTTNPYTSGNSSNALQAKWNAAAERVARAYDCEFVDAFTYFMQIPGGWNSLLNDGTHPNVAGQAKIAEAAALRFPANWTPETTTIQGGSFLRPKVTANRLYLPWTKNRLGMLTLANEVNVDYAAKLNRGGTWTPGTTTGPWTTSTVGSDMTATINGSEAFLTLTMGAGQGVVDIYVDGVPFSTGLDLSTLQNGKLLHLTGLGLGWHFIRVVHVSGSVTYTSCSFTAQRAGWALWDAPSVVASGMGSGAGLGSMPAVNGSSFGAVASAAAGTLTYTFVGTGVQAAFWRTGTGAASYFTSVTVDGVSVGLPNLPTTFTKYGVKTLASGLGYGKHTLVITYSATGIYTGGFSPIDERATERPAQLQGWAGAAEVVKFAQAFTSVPAVVAKDPAAGVTFSSVTAAGFTMGATAGWWVATAGDDAAENRLLY